MTGPTTPKPQLRYSLAQAMAATTRQPSPAKTKYSLAEAMRRMIGSEDSK
jgi:hypothetical protein